MKTIIGQCLLSDRRGMTGMEIRYLHPFSELVSKRSETLPVDPGLTILGLINRLFDAHVNEFKKYGMDHPYSSILVVLNGNVLLEKDWETELGDNDSVLIGMPIAGG